MLASIRNRVEFKLTESECSTESKCSYAYFHGLMVLRAPGRFPRIGSDAILGALRETVYQSASKPLTDFQYYRIRSRCP